MSKGREQKDEVIFITWDWEDQPDWDEVNKAISQFDSPEIVSLEDTGCDSFAIAVKDKSRALSQDEATRLLWDYNQG